MKLRVMLFVTALAVVLAGSRVHAQLRAPLDGAARARAIDGVLRCLREGYVFPEVAAKMERAIRDRAAAGRYAGITEGAQLATALTADLQEVSGDLHIQVGYSAEVLPPEPATPQNPTLEMLEGAREELSRENFGLAKVEVLRGNIGYLDFRYLAPPELAAETYAAAMGFIGNTDALIVDLRRCRGSMSPDAIPMLCSYFFDRPTHLNDIYWRSEGKTRQFWTWAHVPGKRYLHKPIYILTSGATFSGAEELAYDLKSLQRAILVGEKTGGGANPGGDRRADDHFLVWVPNGRVTNPSTGTNWEGVGVAPDVPVPAAKALHTAHADALKRGLARTRDTAWRGALEHALREVERTTPRLVKVTFSLPGHPDARRVVVAGDFNDWSTLAQPLTRRGDAWVGEVELEPGRRLYKFVVDGRWLIDPANPRTERAGEHENSVLLIEEP